MSVSGVSYRLLVLKVRLPRFLPRHLQVLLQVSLLLLLRDLSLLLLLALHLLLVHLLLNLLLLHLLLMHSLLPY